jgi:hypothetical protein
MLKALFPLSILVIAATATAPVFAECVAPINDVRIPKGDKATMDEMVAASHAIQVNTAEIDSYLRCLKAEQNAKIDAIGPDITDDQRAKIASEYVKRQQAVADKQQSLADNFDAAERLFRAKQTTTQQTEEDNQEAAAVNQAELDSAAKAREEAKEQRENARAETPVQPKPH